jgi:hypothetical protein
MEKAGLRSHRVPGGGVTILVPPILTRVSAGSLLRLMDVVPLPVNARGVNPMIKLYDNETRSLLGELDDAQLRFLIDHLEETDSTDQDYYLDDATLDLLEEEGADDGLLSLLREALEGRAGIEVRWEDSAERAF